MADLSTPVALAVTTTGISLASVLPGIDGNALVGAFAGATLFVTSAKELSHLTRLIYLLVSLVMGYLAAPEVVANTFIEQSGVAGFLSGMSVITLTLQLSKRMQDVDIAALLKGGKR
tara:strand:+ start:3449 stop:3799 length:351 start_codon:yes stop_codon:yes gene_type:complete